MTQASSLATILVVSVLVPNAIGSSLRRLDIQSYQAAMGIGNCFAVENGVEYVGNDLTNAPGTVDKCCDFCAATPNCHAWTWSTDNGGTCWLKYTRDKVVANPNAKSALFAYGSQITCQFSNGIEYVGNNLTRVDSAQPEGCCDKCKSTSGCRAYTWSNGSCWLKTEVTQIISTPGAKSAQAYADTVDSCLFPEVDTEYVGNDVGRMQSSTHTACCDACKVRPRCKAYSWSNANGGTCFFKGQKGASVFNKGVTSAQVNI